MDNYNHSAIHGFPTKTTNVNVLILFMVQLKASRNLNIEIFSPIVIIVTRSDKWAQSKTLKKKTTPKTLKKRLCICTRESQPSSHNTGD